MSMILYQILAGAMSSVYGDQPTSLQFISLVWNVKKYSPSVFGCIPEWWCDTL